MNSVVRIDVARLDGSRAERTPQGGLRVPANFTRTGVFEYRNQDGTVRREYRPPTEVFDSDSLASLEDAPVTDLHQGMVNPGNHQALAKGHVRNINRAGNFVAGVVLVQDADLVAAVERGDRVEVSCGYNCKLDMTPGTTPEGEPYHAVQTQVRYNHVALLPRGTGRAGREVALRLDGASYVVLDDAPAWPNPPARNEKSAFETANTVAGAATSSNLNDFALQQVSIPWSDGKAPALRMSKDRTPQ